VGCGVGCGAHGTGRQTEGDLRVKLNARHIAALKRARKLIARKDEDYICWALDSVDADASLNPSHIPNLSRLPNQKHFLTLHSLILTHQ
jgi:hypothetical protein